MKYLKPALFRDCCTACTQLGSGKGVHFCLLSGLCCCWGFSGIYFFAVWAGAFFFAVGAGAQAPPKQEKKTRPRPFRAWFLFAVWAAGCVYFFCWRRTCFFCCLGGWRFCFFFAVWAGACFFCCLGRGRVFLLVGRGTGIHSLTRLPGSSRSDPTTKATERQKQNTGSLNKAQLRRIDWHGRFPVPLLQEDCEHSPPVRQSKS